MANIKSQKKRIRQDKKRNIRNKSIKTQLKGVLKSVENEKVENKQKSLAEGQLFLILSFLKSLLFCKSYNCLNIF